MARSSIWDSTSSSCKLHAIDPDAGAGDRPVAIHALGGLNIQLVICRFELGASGPHYNRRSIPQNSELRDLMAVPKPWRAE